ncbi:Na(+)-linked D-alanine glycine permease [Candidatus Similichlamydia laticola]|uniref:Na(+)-linked D-alanine glycine permease n=2 Tax=Candidatus Similichlamydia laticola TaxID=2170265 RepID=A0A369KID4_9BACT|nr:Na(+)-linked D-alanine glycine permease [Candidatus Similichlamydia laticola]
MEFFLSGLLQLDPWLWGGIGVPFVLGTGTYLSFRSRFIQIRFLSSGLFGLFAKDRTSVSSFFASVGGAVGIGNVIGVCSMLASVGPGAVLWFWIGAFFGILLKYAEVYLAVRFKGEQNGMVSYLCVAFQKHPYVPKLASLLSCVYGIEIYQFNVVRDSVSEAWGMPKLIVSLSLLFFVFLGVRGGFQRVGKVSSKILPPLLLLYFFMSLCVLFVFRSHLANVFTEILIGFFDPSSVAPGLGASSLLAASQGLAKGCYATDIGTGYSGMIYSSSPRKEPFQMAKLVLLEPIFDAFGVCTLSLLLVLSTGVWREGLSSGFLVQASLGTVFPYSKQIVSVLLSLLGYSTITAFLATGIESAKFLSPRKGATLYGCLAACLWVTFSFLDAEIAFLFMSFCGFGLLMINVLAFVRLRNHIQFCHEHKGV